MSPATKLVIHLGYPKTGTTTFQNRVFPNHPDIDYLGKFIPSHRYREHETFFQVDALIRTNLLHPIDVTPLRDYIQRIREDSSQSAVLLSSESFLHPTAIDIGVVIKRIKSVFEPCKILLTIREQLDVLRSFHYMHGQYGQYFYVDSLNDNERLKYPMAFDKWVELQRRAPDKNLLGTLRYYEVISSLIGHFGQDSVHVALYEELVSDASSYARKLSRAMGINEEITVGLLAKHRDNATTRPSFRDRLMRRWRQYEPGAEQTAFVAEYYRAGNKALGELLSLPLASFGYKV